METYFFINLIVERFFTHEICVCAHLTQTRYVQRACAEMGIIMKKKTRNQRNVVGMSVIMLMLAAGMLAACSNSKTEETTVVEGTEQVEEPAQDDAAVTEQDQENEDTAASKNVEESKAVESGATEETETQSVVYEGIDMESTLPGLEWIESFNGVIEEPKLVIFNDDTNKKIILENGQKIDFSEGDNLLIYAPIGKSAYLREGQSDSSIFDEITSEKNYQIMSKLSVLVHDGDEIPLRYDITGDYEYTLTATLVAVLNN